MPDDTKKLDSFIKEIMSDAKNESESILASVERDRRRALESARNEYRVEAESFYQSEIIRIRAESGRAISQKLMDNKRVLHQYRQEQTDELTKDVIRKLEAYTQTPEYIDHLHKLLGSALAQFHYEPVVVYLRPADVAMAAQVGQALPRAGITFEEGAIQLGGLICECPKRRLRADLTFDSRLAEISSRYSELFEWEANDG